jgi:hypothetical protein
MARWRYRFLLRVLWRSHTMFECEGEPRPPPRPLPVLLLEREAARNAVQENISWAPAFEKCSRFMASLLPSFDIII